MKKPFLLLLFTFFILAFSFAQQQGIGISIEKKPLWFGDEGETISTTKEPVSRFPPFCGEKLRNNGNTLSLPFGVGLQATFMEQDFIAADLQVANDINDITATADTIYQNTRSGYSQVTTRIDLWLLSFLNIYGIVGYTHGRISPNLTIPYIVINLPGIDSFIIDTTFEIHDKLTYVGPTFGGGATVSAGFKSFFFVFDYNYTVTRPVDIYANIINQSFSPKIGIFLGKQKSKLSGALWVGSMFLSNEHNFSGTISVSEIASELLPIFGETATYSGTVTPVNQWNMLFGASMVIDSRHYISVETGYIGRKQISIMYDFRF